MSKTEALSLFGGRVRALAQALGITQQAVSQWGEIIPPLRSFQIAEIVAARAQ